MVDETLSSKRISDIYQDHDGFIWVSTDNGLNRFDGNKVFAYNHVEGDTLSYSSERPTRTSALWLGPRLGTTALMCS